jgi:hypothetical protein
MNAARDCDGGFQVGQRVCIRDNVRPRQYAWREGAIAEMRRVVPPEIVDALHRDGKTTNNGDFELGVRFSHSRSQPVSWFLPRDLVKAGHGRSEASSCPASPVPSASVPAVASRAQSEASR